MSSHNVEAAYASAEIAGYLQENQDLFLGGMGDNGAWSIYAGSEGGARWPLADGVICAINPMKEVNIAFEFKRLNEGVHGILTALGQSYAYLEKGYDASVMAIPGRYSSHSSPGEHISRIIDSSSPDIPIWVFTYDEPDLSVTRPFRGKLTCVRRNNLATCQHIQRSAQMTTSGKITTLWAHVREGMSHPDAFYKFCKSVKIITSVGEDIERYVLPQELIDAVYRLAPNANVFYYLSNTSSDTLLDKAWRRDWFMYYFWERLAPIYSVTPTGQYVVNDIPTKVQINNESNQNLFSGRRDSIKNKLVDRLNANSITVEKAWEEYAKKVRNDAHSYREVIDSGLSHIGFINTNGELTELGYKFVDACDRYNSAYEIMPMQILRASFLQNGQYAALLHYIFKLSEEAFDNNIYSFTRENRIFDKDDYRSWLMENLNNRLHLVQTSSLRAGGTRKPLQSEIWLLNRLGLIRSTATGHAAYRIGTGLCIDWPQVETSLQFYNTL